MELSDEFAGLREEIQLFRVELCRAFRRLQWMCAASLAMVVAVLLRLYEIV